MIGTPEIALIGFDYLDATEQDDLRRNLNLLYETVEGTCPGDRLFGLNPTFQDAPVNVAMNLFMLEVVEKTEVYEDKAEVVDITYTQSVDGNLTPKIIIKPKHNDSEESSWRG